MNDVRSPRKEKYTQPREINLALVLPKLHELLGLLRELEKRNAAARDHKKTGVAPVSWTPDRLGE